MRKLLALQARLWATASMAALAACGGGDGPVAANQAPVATIASPAAGSTFRAGDTLNFTGSATDSEDGVLAAISLTWWAELHHDAHSHPFVPQTSGGSGTATLPTRGETSDNIFYRFHLRVTDSAGATHEVTRDVLPRKAQVTLASVPSGLALTLDGQPVSAPSTFTGVVGTERDLVAADQNFNNRRYRFATWSDGGAAAHTVATPAANTTYTATFTDLGPVVNNPPTVSLTAPATGTIGVAIALTATAADADDRVAGVEFFDNGVKIGATDISAPYGLSWTPTAPGARSLTARATDNFNLAATSAAVVVTVGAAGGDAQAPVVSIPAPANLASGLTGTLPVTANATDNVGVTSIEIQIDGQPVGSMGSGASHSVSIDSNAYASGQHILRARASDAAGNRSAWVVATVAFGGSRSQPAGFTRIAGWIAGLSSATAFAQTPDGRLLVAQQGGALRVVNTNGTLGATMLNLSVDAAGERGLIGVAVHPSFASNGFVYVYYTRVNGGSRNNRISRFTASGDSAAGEFVIADLPDLSGATNHNGGAMHFGNDGKLYVAVGDNANSAKAPNLADPFGKMLRFDDDGAIPSDNLSSPRRAAWRGRSGPTACATPSPSRCARAMVASTSTTSARAVGKKSMSAYPAPTMAGPAPKARRPLPASRRRCSPTTTTAHRRPAQAVFSAAARSPAVRSTAPAAPSRRPTATATTSPTSVPDSWAAWTWPMPTPPMPSARSMPIRSICSSAWMARCWC